MNNNKIYEDIYNSAPCGYLSSLANGVIIRTNKTLLNLLGYSKKEIEGKKSFQDLLSIGGKIYFETHFMPLLLHQKEVKEINFDIINKSGNRIPVLINTVFTEKIKGEEVYLYTILDITQRKQYEKELLLAKENAEKITRKLAVANKELERFSRVVSHDIKSPLHSIVGLTELLETKLATCSKEEALELLKLIKISSSKLSELVQNILQYYTKSDISNLAPENVDLKELVEKVISISDPQSNVVFTLSGDFIQIKTYSTVLELILLNLIVNSMKYNDKEQVKIEISFSKSADYYEFSVVDNGIGIKKENLEKIFSPLETLNAKDRFNQKGTGLGLAYVKKMVEKLGGTIIVKSEYEAGSTFTFVVNKLV